MNKLTPLLGLILCFLPFPDSGTYAQHPEKKWSNDRFTVHADGTIVDTRTQLMWYYRESDTDINWHEAERYCEDFDIGGYNNWRLPKVEELAELYKALKKDKEVPFEIVNDFIWAANRTGSHAEGFHMNFGSYCMNTQADTVCGRALPVRRVKE